MAAIAQIAVSMVAIAALSTCHPYARRWPAPESGEVLPGLLDAPAFPRAEALPDCETWPAPSEIEGEVRPPIGLACYTLAHPIWAQAWTEYLDSFSHRPWRTLRHGARFWFEHRRAPCIIGVIEYRDVTGPHGAPASLIRYVVRENDVCEN